MESVFRAYDIRGIYPKEINNKLAEEVAECLAKDFFKKGEVVVGRDARIGSKPLYDTVVKTLRKNGVRVRGAGLTTTPMLYFLVHDLKMKGGVMITASHNPKEYNGIKVLGRNGIPISGEDIYKKLKPEV